MKFAYKKKRFGADAMKKVDQANTIIAEYQKHRMKLTLRQLYYQFVARGFIPNNYTEYKRLGNIISEARLGGMIDWDAMEDRGRDVQERYQVETPALAIGNERRRFHCDWWLGQKTYVEVWIEKDALVGVIEPACRRHDVPYFACKGNPSQSAMWEAGNRFVSKLQNDERHAEFERAVILYLGDHDPTGIDITRDVEDRMRMFLDPHTAMEGQCAASDVLEVKRIALNIDQVEKYNPPPNPVKDSDSRTEKYRKQFGVEECWELDALDPVQMDKLVDKHITSFIDDDEKLQARMDYETKCKEELQNIIDGWTFTTEYEAP